MRPIRDYSPEDYDAVADGRPRFARFRRGLSTAIGAAVAMALLVALGIWFYRLGARDAENVPIIRAAAEPTKTRPEEPGGVVTPYQDVTSYGVAESGAAATPAVIVAPPTPEPRREDVAMGMLAPEPTERPDAMTTAEIDVAPPSPMSEADEIAALVREATLDIASTPKPEPEPAALAERESQPHTADGTSAPVPPARPSDLLARVQDAVRSAEESAAELTRQAAKSPVQIQLAADPDEQVVRTIWRRIAQANSDILHDRELAVQPITSGGTTFYRLRVGPFSGMSEAQAVCQALKARGQDCIVARNG